MLTLVKVEQDVSCEREMGVQDEFEQYYDAENPRLEDRLQSLGNQQELIITILQNMQKNDDEHNANAATRDQVTSEGFIVRRHTEEQVEKMRKTIEQLREYIDSHSAKRQLTIYSTVLLSAACLLLLANMLSGPLTIRSPIPELGVAVAVGFMLMARFAPKHK